MITIKYKQIKILLIILLYIAMGITTTYAQTIRVAARIAANDIYVNIPFQYQVILDGSDQPADVDVSSLADFNPQSLGGSNRSSRSVTIINGKQTINEQKLYIMAWQLTPAKTGEIQIPPVTVTYQGKEYTTNPVSINVLRPGTTDRLHLEVNYSATEAYLGQPITMTVNWYRAVRVGDISINLPAMNDSENFFIENVPQPPGYGGDLISLKLGDQDIVARRTESKLSGREAYKLAFQLILIPRQTGTIEIPASSATCDVEVSSGSSRDDFFGGDFFGRNRQYKKYTCQSAPATLTIKPLPMQNRPANFNNLIGTYNIQTTATPTDNINVGDPITLNIIISGDLLNHVDIPDLTTIPAFANNFKITTENATPKIEGNQKTFTLTIRPKHESITEIPAIPLSYFDVDKGEYLTTQSDPISIEVKETNIVSVSQAEGSDFTPRQQSEIQALRKGIAANVYHQAQLLRNTAFSPIQALAKPAYLILWIVPLLIVVLVALLQIIKHSDPVKEKQKRQQSAARNAIKALNSLPSKLSDNKDQLAEILRQYIGDRFDRLPNALTSSDCRQLLTQANVQPKQTDQFAALLEQCEQSRFAGPSAGTIEQSPTDIAELIKEVEKTI